MATYTKRVLGGSTDGRGFLVVPIVVGSATTVHTASTGIDLVTIWAYNAHTSSVILTLCWGGTTDPGDLILTTIPSKSALTLVTADMPIRNSLDIKAYAGTASVISLFGNANRIA